MPRAVDQSQTARIELEEAYRQWSRGSAVFLDVRDEEAYIKSHIPGAHCIRLTAVARGPTAVTKDAEVVLY
jgi:rhodanese-related sulfurtransferase